MARRTTTIIVVAVLLAGIAAMAERYAGLADPVAPGAAPPAVAAATAPPPAAVTADGVLARIELALGRPLTPEEAPQVRATATAAAAELQPIRERFLREVSEIAELPPDVIAQMLPEQEDPSPTQTLTPAIERRTGRPLNLTDRRRLIEAELLRRRATLTVHHRLAQQLAELLQLDYSRLRSIFPSGAAPNAPS